MKQLISTEFEDFWDRHTGDCRAPGPIEARFLSRADDSADSWRMNKSLSRQRIKNYHSGYIGKVYAECPCELSSLNTSPLQKSDIEGSKGIG